MGSARNWTKEEKEYLRAKWGQMSIPSIAKALNRSVSGVKNMACRLHLGPALMGADYVSINQLLKAVRGNASGGGYILRSWVQNRGLPIRRKRVDKCSFTVIRISDFWEWAEANRAFVDFSKMEPMALGAEPKWVTEQRKNDFRGYALQRKDPWTAEDDSQLLMLLSQHKYGYAELSKRLRRSAGAIQRRCQDLGTKDRPVRAEAHDAWTDADYEILADGVRTGRSYTDIGLEIGKSEKAIRGKIYYEYLTENSDKVRAYMGDGPWGAGAPAPVVRQALHLSRGRGAVKADLERLCGLLQYRAQTLRERNGFDTYFQRSMCQHWDREAGVCRAGGSDCDTCEYYLRKESHQ